MSDKFIGPSYLGDAVYAQFSNRMIGLGLDSHENPPLVWLEKEVYLALKRYAQTCGWEPPDVLPEEVEPLGDISWALRTSLALETRRLSTWLQIQPQYQSIYQRLINEARLKEAVVTWDTSDLNFMFSGTGKHLAQVFRVMRTSGFELEGDRPRAKESSWHGRFVHPETNLRVWFSFTSTVCQVKQVRTEMKEVPVYDVVCDEGTDAEDRAELAGNNPGESSSKDIPLGNEDPIGPPGYSSDPNDDIPF